MWLKVLCGKGVYYCLLGSFQEKHAAELGLWSFPPFFLLKVPMSDEYMQLFLHVGCGNALFLGDQKLALKRNNG